MKRAVGEHVEGGIEIFKLASIISYPWRNGWRIQRHDGGVFNNRPVKGGIAGGIKLEEEY